jgi:apolipoprotein N-acyltransferase
LKQSNINTSLFKHPLIRNFSVVLLVLIVLPYIYGIIKVNEYRHDEFIRTHQTVRVGLVQPNINPWVKWKRNVFEQIIQHLKLQDSLVNKVQKIDMMIWSETALPFLDFSTNSDHNFGIVKRWTDERDISVLTGFSDIYLYKKNETPSITAKKVGNTDIYYDSFNASVLLNPNDNNKPEVYHKMKLTPFSENLPFVETFPFLRGWIEWGVGISSWKKGENQSNLTFMNNGKKFEVASIICIESIYPGFVRNFADMGAELFVIITNDAWYNYTFGPEQHFVIARMRAVESRRYIARVANSGRTGYIAASGEQYSMVPQYQSVAAYGDVALSKERTLYTDFGDYLPVFSVALTLISILGGFFIRKH